MDDVHIKLASLEGQLSVMNQAMARIEDQLQKVVMLDRAVAEITVRQLHTSDAIDHVRQRLEEQRETQDATAGRLHARIDTSTRESSRFENKVTGALYVVVALLGIVAGAAGWVLLRLDDNTRINAVQEMRIDRLEYELKELQRQAAGVLVPIKPGAGAATH